MEGREKKVPKGEESRWLPVWINDFSHRMQSDCVSPYVILIKVHLRIDDPMGTEVTRTHARTYVINQNERLTIVRNSVRHWD